MKDIECPYCQHEQDICHDDGQGYEEDVKHEMQCSNCDNFFVFYTSIIYHYEALKADCLNDGIHNWEAQRCYPKEYTKMECSMCGEKRTPTDEEMKIILENDN